MDFRVLLMSCLFGASLVKGEGGCRDLQYLECEQDKSLTGHVIKTIRMLAQGLEECQHQCFIDDRCVSYNLGPVFGVIRSCELNNADHVEYPDDVISVPGAEYCPIKNPCASSPCPKNQTCRPDFEFNTFRCEDNSSCAGLNRLGENNNGVYNITPIPGYTIQVFCDQITDGGGWTVIQKRLDGSVDFFLGWDDYKRGFGNKNGEYWLGLDAMYILTNSIQNEIRIDLEDFSMSKTYAMYDLFKVGTESQKYELFLGSFKEGNAGDSLGYHRWAAFSTFDRDTGCANRFKGAWWFGKCLRTSSSLWDVPNQDKTNSKIEP
ncbi:microfibril-associated glycoprotein 4-like isoform X2 [Actinia tenebrosa]|uniref:Microfibril-associated glycoprotein 4-like isoform X2 n=1 Tax=Actinia tenebrosa TaxID=6105 RepID=A0A6P8ICT9_ACTTE|nr:microfibril-associated glycoprotein 4-like isoform X2 [Actinia tenebrosa]